MPFFYESIFCSFILAYCYFVTVISFSCDYLSSQVENELPEKIERLVRCEASAYQKLLMKRVEDNLGSIGNSKVYLCLGIVNGSWIQFGK